MNSLASALSAAVISAGELSTRPIHKRKKPASASRTSKATSIKGGATKTLAMVTDQGRLPVVGIGASAGGLEALKACFGAMSPRTGLVFVVVVHLDPTHESLMPELLSHLTGLAVQQARDRQPLEVDHVYVIPPNRTLTIDQGLLRVSEVADRRSLRGAIDHFFRSLAEAERDRAVAIVLSGTGTEGTLGARAPSEVLSTMAAVCAHRRAETARCVIAVLDAMPAFA